MSKRIFIGFSKPRSYTVASALYACIGAVFAKEEPWLSSVDLLPGAKWADPLAGQLRSSSIGIFVVTPENQGEPWLNYEAGALSACVVPYLVGMGPEDLTGPLAQFQAKNADRGGTYDVCRLINCQLGATDSKQGGGILTEEQLRERFGEPWAKMEKALTELRRVDQPQPPRSEDCLREILAILQVLTGHLTGGTPKGGTG